MLEKLHTFKLKLLSTSKEVGLRRLRSYAASLGGGAQIYNGTLELFASYDEDQLPTVLLIDGSVPLSNEELVLLSKSSRIFLLDQNANSLDRAPDIKDPCWSVEAYIQCSLSAYLAAPICRINAAHLCDQNKKFELSKLVRWGHARKIWTPGYTNSISSAGIEFIRDYFLISNWRRSTEMFCHFAECNISPLGLTAKQIDFASDGLMLLNVVRCEINESHRGRTKEMIRLLSEELRVFNFSISAINQLPNNELEIAVYHCPVHEQANHDGPVVLIYNQYAKPAISLKPKEDETEENDVTSDMEKAG
jgi:hypothetical protein